MKQFKDREQERDALIAAVPTATAASIGNASKQDAQPTPSVPGMLLELKGIGPETASVLWLEGLSRKFNNRRQVAAYAGLAASHWQSGQIDQDQGVSKSGNPRLRTTLIQLAWLWVQHQPDSSLTIWFKTRVTERGPLFQETSHRRTRAQVARSAMEIR